MKNKDFAFSKITFILIGVSMLIVIIDFLLMPGVSSTSPAFNSEIF